MRTLSFSRLLNVFSRLGFLFALMALITASLGLSAANVSAAPTAGGFLPHPSVPTFGLETPTNQIEDVQLGDVDQDGDLDALVVQWLITDPSRVWLNEGDGRFLTSIVLDLGVAGNYGDSNSGAFYDFNGDTYLDVVLTNFQNDFTRSEFIWLNNGDADSNGVWDGAFTLVTEFNEGIYNTHKVLIGNIDADPAVELITIQGLYELRIYTINGTNMVYDGAIPNTYVIYDAVLANIDNDGDLDMLLCGLGGIEIMLNDGNGIFTVPPSPQVPPLPNPYPSVANTHILLMGDVDGDADIDMVAGMNNAAQVFFNNSQGDFIFPTNLPTSVPGSTIHRGDIGDIDGDGDLDVVLANEDSAQDEIFLNDGAGNFSHNPVTASVAAGLFTRVTRLGDIDGDEDLDLLTASDGEGVRVWLNNVAPTVNPIAALPGSEGTLFTLNLSGSVQDADDPLPDPAPFTYTLTDNPVIGSVNAAGEFTWTPGETFGGSATTIHFRVTDRNGAYADGSFTVNVAETNQAPVVSSIPQQPAVEGQAFSLNLLSPTAYVTDADDPDNTLHFSLTGAGQFGILTDAGLFTWTPVEDHGGSGHTVNFQVNDGAGGTASGSFTINVAESNQVPVVRTIPLQQVNEGSTFTLDLIHPPAPATAYVTDADVPPNQLNFALTGQSAGSITSAGVYSLPTTESNGGSTFDITFSVSDGTATVNGSFQVQVNDTNLAPVVNIPQQNATEGQVFNLLLASPLVSDADLPAQTLEFSLTGSSPGTLSSTGDFAWTPGENHGGYPAVTVTFDVFDGTATTHGSFQVLVAEVNVNPVIGSIPPQNVAEGSTFSLNLMSPVVYVTDTDLPANTFSFELTNGSRGSITTGGVYSLPTTESDGGGTIMVSFSVSDGHGGSANSSFEVHVTEVNQIPVLTAPVSGNITANLPYSIVLAGTDADANPADTLTYGVDMSTLPDGADFNTTTHTFTWTPTLAQLGPHTVTFTIDDTHGITEFDVNFTVVEPKVTFLPLVKRAP